MRDAAHNLAAALAEDGDLAAAAARLEANADLTRRRRPPDDDSMREADGSLPEKGGDLLEPEIADDARLVADDARLVADDARRLAALGVVRKRQGRLDEAARALDAALALDPADARSRIARGNVAALTGDLEGAVASLAAAAAAATRPRDRADAENSRGVVLEELGRREDAAAAYDAALAAAPGHAKATANRDALRGGGGGAS